jgi:hypothetical protein
MMIFLFYEMKNSLVKEVDTSFYYEGKAVWQLWNNPLLVEDDNIYKFSIAGHC